MLGLETRTVRNLHIVDEPVRRAASGAQAPSGSIRDTYGSSPRKTDRKEQNFASFRRAIEQCVNWSCRHRRKLNTEPQHLQIEAEILSSPIFRDDRKDE